MAQGLREGGPMIILPRAEAKERILRLMQERQDRSRYIIGDQQGVRPTPQLDLADLLPPRRDRDDRS